MGGSQLAQNNANNKSRPSPSKFALFAIFIALSALILVGCEPSADQSSTATTPSTDSVSGTPASAPDRAPDPSVIPTDNRSEIVASEPTRTPVPETQPTRQVSPDDPNDLTACIATAVDRETAVQIKLVDGQLSFGNLDPNRISPANFAAIFRCAGISTDDLSTQPTPAALPTSPSGSSPTQIPTMPAPAPAIDGEITAFRNCVASALGQRVADSVDIFDGQVAFIGTPPTDPADTTTILNCATDLGLVSNPGSSQSASSTPQPTTGDLTLTAQDLEFRACVAGSFRSELSEVLKLTGGGLPDFSSLADLELNIADFQSIIDCVPQLGAQLTLRDLDSSDRSTAQAVADAAAPAVVFLETDAGSAGVGFFITATGLLITNQHVVADANEIFVWLKDGTKLTATYLGGETIPDIAVLQLNESVNVSPLTFGTVNALAPGDHLITIGHPAGIGNWVSSIGEFLDTELTSKSPLGSTSGPIESIEILTTLPATSGNSGSPVLDSSGKVVGVVHAGTPRQSTQQDGRPIVSRYPTSERLVITASTQAIPIELALNMASTLTGDTSLAATTTGSVRTQRTS